MGRATSLGSGRSSRNSAIPHRGTVELGRPDIIVGPRGGARLKARRTRNPALAAAFERPRNDRQYVNALSRGLRILSCFRVDAPHLGNAEIADRCGLPRSTVSRLTYTLTKIDCLEFDGRVGKYRLGSRVLSLGHTMLAGFDVGGHVLPYMQRLADFANSLVTLAVREDFSMLCLTAARSASSLAPPIDPGTHISIATTAMGRAYLASASRAERDRILEHLALTKPAAWPSLQRGLEKSFREYAKLGYCITLEDWRKGHNGAAVPLYLKNVGRRVVLSCGGPAFQFPRNEIFGRIGPFLLRIASEIELSFEKMLPPGHAASADGGGRLNAWPTPR